ncbi:hypothetical protein [Kitasatospora sp. NPDC058046]|uniref:hypothetical protein n=1 Tax=Kitasatospora sp. NPDC058046 TaxID=3346312 RepID=UPI0036DABDE1
MTRGTPRREYRDVVPAAPKFQRRRPRPGRSPLEDYREAQAADGGRDSKWARLQASAIRSTCTCRDCTAKRRPV